MNWVGGVRSRIRMQQGRKQQREFFERKKYASKVHRARPASPNKKKGISQDLLSLHTINKTHALGKSEEKRQVNVVNLDKRGSKRTWKEDVELPMSPLRHASKIQLMDVRESLLSKEKDQGQREPSEDQASVAYTPSSKMLTDVETPYDSSVFKIHMTSKIQHSSVHPACLEEKQYSGQRQPKQCAKPRNGRVSPLNIKKFQLSDELTPFLPHPATNYKLEKTSNQMKGLPKHANEHPSCRKEYMQIQRMAVPVFKDPQFLPAQSKKTSADNLFVPEDFQITPLKRYCSPKHTKRCHKEITCSPCSPCSPSELQTFPVQLRINKQPCLKDTDLCRNLTMKSEIMREKHIASSTVPQRCGSVDDKLFNKHKQLRMELPHQYTWGTNFSPHQYNLQAHKTGEFVKSKRTEKDHKENEQKLSKHIRLSSGLDVESSTDDSQESAESTVNFSTLCTKDACPEDTKNSSLYCTDNTNHICDITMDSVHDETTECTMEASVPQYKLGLRNLLNARQTNSMSNCACEEAKQKFADTMNNKYLDTKPDTCHFYSSPVGNCKGDLSAVLTSTTAIEDQTSFTSTADETDEEDPIPVTKEAKGLTASNQVEQKQDPEKQTFQTPEASIKKANNKIVSENCTTIQTARIVHQRSQTSAPTTSSSPAHKATKMLHRNKETDEFIPSIELSVSVPVHVQQSEHISQKHEEYLSTSASFHQPAKTLMNSLKGGLKDTSSLPQMQSEAHKVMQDLLIKVTRNVSQNFEVTISDLCAEFEGSITKVTKTDVFSDQMNVHAKDNITFMEQASGKLCQILNSATALVKDKQISLSGTHQNTAAIGTSKSSSTAPEKSCKQCSQANQTDMCKETYRCFHANKSARSQTECQEGSLPMSTCDHNQEPHADCLGETVDVRKRVKADMQTLQDSHTVHQSLTKGPESMTNFLLASQTSCQENIEHSQSIEKCGPQPGTLACHQPDSQTKRQVTRDTGYQKMGQHLTTATGSQSRTPSDHQPESQTISEVRSCDNDQKIFPMDWKPGSIEENHCSTCTQAETSQLQGSAQNHPSGLKFNSQQECQTGHYKQDPRVGQQPEIHTHHQSVVCHQLQTPTNQQSQSPECKIGDQDMHRGCSQAESPSPTGHLPCLLQTEFSAQERDASNRLTPIQGVSVCGRKQTNTCIHVNDMNISDTANKNTSCTILVNPTIDQSIETEPECQKVDAGVQVLWSHQSVAAQTVESRNSKQVVMCHQGTSTADLERHTHEVGVQTIQNVGVTTGTSTDICLSPSTCSTNAQVQTDMLPFIEPMHKENVSSFCVLNQQFSETAWNDNSIENECQRTLGFIIESICAVKMVNLPPVDACPEFVPSSSNYDLGQHTQLG